MPQSVCCGIGMRRSRGMGGVGGRVKGWSLGMVRWLGGGGGGREEWEERGAYIPLIYDSYNIDIPYTIYEHAQNCSKITHCGMLATPNKTPHRELLNTHMH